MNQSHSSDDDEAHVEARKVVPPSMRKHERQVTTEGDQDYGKEDHDSDGKDLQSLGSKKSKGDDTSSDGEYIGDESKGDLEKDSFQDSSHTDQDHSIEEESDSKRSDSDDSAFKSVDESDDETYEDESSDDSEEDEGPKLARRIYDAKYKIPS